MKKWTVTRRILLLIVAHFTGGLTLQPRARLPVSSTSTRGSTAASLTRMGSTAAPRRVAIIGAGPAGLTLANALLQQGAEAYDEVAVFDRFGELKPGTGGGLQINGGAAVLAAQDRVALYQAEACGAGDPEPLTGYTACELNKIEGRAAAQQRAAGDPGAAGADHVGEGAPGGRGG